VVTYGAMIEQFARHLKSRGRPETTTKNYVCEVLRFASWLYPVSLRDASPAHLTRYLDELVRRGAALATHNRTFYALKRFYDFLASELRAIEANPLAFLRPQKHEPPPPEALSRRDIKRVLASMDGRARDRALFLLLLSSGIRLSEGLALNVEDISFDRNGLTVRITGGNGKPEREAFPSRQCARVVAAYLRERGDDPGPLFLSRNGRRLAARTVQANFARYFQKAGANGNARWLRHTFAIRRLKAGAGLADLQHLMGHKTMQSIQRYANLNGNDVRKVAIQTEEVF